jgi:hypothetical protein
MNLKKFTKAELISKINGLKTKNNDNNSSFSTNLLGSLLLFKTFLLKITLIALVIKVFKKYSIFRKLWTFFSFILYSIFGISLIDIYEIEILSKFLNNILDVFTKFNASILELFSKKVEIPVEIPVENPSRLKTINSNSTGSKESNKIIERFSKIIHKEPIEVSEPIEIIEENTPLYQNKYVIIGGILILSCLSWYFYDDIKPIASSLWATINSFRPRPSNDGNDSNSSVPRGFKTNLQSLKDKVYEQMYGKGDKTPSNASIALGEAGPSKGKNIDINNLSQAEIDRRRLLELYQVELDRREGLQEQLTGLRDITGNSFTEESETVLAEIETFLDYTEKSKFPKPEVAAGIYNLLRERLLKLSQTSVRQYDQLTENRVVNSRIEKFLDLEAKVYGDVIPSQDVNPGTSPGLNNYAYDDIALSTIQEQETWSDYAKSPSDRSHLLSPINVGEPLTDNSDGSSPYRFQVQTLPNPPMPISEMQDRLPYRQLTPPSDLDHYFPPSQYAQELIRNNENAQSIDVVPTPNIEIATPEIPQVENKSGFAALLESIRNRGKDKNAVTSSTQPEASGSSNVIETQPVVTNSSTVIENKPKLNSLLEQINARRNDRDVVASPNISNVGLQTPIQERLNTSPLVHKPSLTNMFDDTMNLFDDEPIDTGIDTSGESSNVDIINSANLVALIDSLDKVKVDIDTNNHKLNFNFGGLEDKIKSIHTATNDGYTANFDYKGENTYSWDNRSALNNYATGCRIKDIFIMDKEGKTYNIYHRDPVL